MSNFYLTFN